MMIFFQDIMYVLSTGFETHMNIPCSFQFHVILVEILRFVNSALNVSFLVYFSE